MRRHELTRRAELEAQEIVDGGRAREREIRLGAEDYAGEILDTLEVNLSKFISAIWRGRERLQDPISPPMSGDTSDPLALADTPHLGAGAGRPAQGALRLL